MKAFRHLPWLQMLPRLAAVFILAGATAAEGASQTYKYFRFTPTKFRNATTPEVQLSEFRFRLGTTAVVPTTVTAPSGNSPTAEGPANLKDGSLDTKWFSFAHSPLVFAFSADVTVDNYSFATGNDEDGRDPVSWTLEGSHTGNATDWTMLDVVTDYATTINRKAWVADFVIPAELPPSISFFEAEPVVVLNGDSTDLYWFADGATQFKIDPGAIVTDALDYFVQPPANADTEYTFTASNSAGSISAKRTVRSVAGGSATYRYIRFKPLLTRNTTGAEIQMSDFRFYANHNTDEKVPLTVSEEGGSPTETAKEGPNKLRDGTAETKWYSATKKNLIFDFGTPQAFDTYRITTGNDAPDRDPIRWTLEGSNDATAWTRIDDLSLFDYSMPVPRGTETTIPLPGGSLPPLATFSADGIKVLAGDPVKFNWTTQDAATVTISPQVGTVTASGSQSVVPAASGNFTLTATSPAGFKTVMTVPVTVVNKPGAAIAYSNFDTESGELSLVGFAAILNDFANIPLPANAKRLRVCPEVAGRGGAAWFPKRLPLAGGFDTTFGFMMTKGDTGVGADGMAFVIQDDPAGDGVLGSGEAGIATRSLNIQLDTYKNTGETSAGYLRVLTGTTLKTAVDLTANSSIALHSSTSPVSLTTARSAAPHLVRVNYVPGKLNIWFDGTQVVTDLAIDLSAVNAVNADGKGLVGFTARTGGFWSAHDITSWSLTTSGAVASTPLAITAYSINPKTGQASLTWASNAGKSYRITSSADLTSFPTVISTGIPSGGSQTTLSFSFTPGAKGFFRVEEIQ